MNADPNAKLRRLRAFVMSRTVEANEGMTYARGAAGMVMEIVGEIDRLLAEPEPAQSESAPIRIVPFGEVPEGSEFITTNSWLNGRRYRKHGTEGRGCGEIVGFGRSAPCLVGLEHIEELKPKWVMEPAPPSQSTTCDHEWRSGDHIYRCDQRRGHNDHSLSVAHWTTHGPVRRCEPLAEEVARLYGFVGPDGKGRP